jgi:hypothetical protein
MNQLLRWLLAIGLMVAGLLAIAIAARAEPVSYSVGYSVTALRGQYTHIQLWNPADSGRSVVVKLVRISLEGQLKGAAILSNRSWTGQGALPVLFRNAIESYDLAQDNTSKAELRTFAGAEQLGGILEANAAWESTVERLLRPGMGLLVRGSDTGGLLKVTFVWEETP